MRILVQRVQEAQVTVGSKVLGEIKKGLCVFVGFSHQDTPDQITEMAQKLLNLRIFSDIEGKMNESLLDVQGRLLVVSQFTLYAECKGRRPSFTKAMHPHQALLFYRKFIEIVGSLGKKFDPNFTVESGEFGSHMEVRLTNDGPVTLFIEN